MTKPELGTVWERDGKQREVVEVIGGNNSWDVYWRRPGSTARTQPSWCTTWDQWVSKATQVETLPRKDQP